MLYTDDSRTDVYEQSNFRKVIDPDQGASILIHDLCRFIDILLRDKPKQHIFNVANREMISARDWVRLCYEVAGKAATFVNVSEEIGQRNYFPFYDYTYRLDVSGQYEWMNKVKPLQDGLAEAYAWYREHKGEVNRKPFMEYIDAHF